MRRGLFLAAALLGLLMSVLYMAGGVPADWLYVLRSALRVLGMVV